jgi:hypothetical protein
MQSLDRLLKEKDPASGLWPFGDGVMTMPIPDPHHGSYTTRCMFVVFRKNRDETLNVLPVSFNRMDLPGMLPGAWVDKIAERFESLSTRMLSVEKLPPTISVERIFEPVDHLETRATHSAPGKA